MHHNFIYLANPLTLNVIMLNREIVPPDADMRYESFLDKAKQGTASSLLVSVRQLLMSCMPLLGCHNWGGTLVVACIQYLITMKLSTVVPDSTFSGKIRTPDGIWMIKGLPFTLPLKLRSFCGHFQSRWVAFDAKAKMALPAFV